MKRVFIDYANHVRLEGGKDESHAREIHAKAHGD